MNTRLRFQLLLAALAVVFAVSTASFAQPRVGGYKAVPAEDAFVVEAADFAVEAQSDKTGTEIELGDIVKAERQVVQGSNYRLCLMVSAGGDEAFHVQAVVYMDLKKVYKLTSWTESSCGGKMEGTGTGPAASVYKEVDDFTNDAGVDLASQFAVREQGKKTKSAITLTEVLGAEDQEPMLGARTFKLCLSVATKGKPSIIETVVSMDQYSNFKLLSWAPSTAPKN